VRDVGLGPQGDLVIARLEAFAQALSAEMGAPITYAREAQVPLAAAQERPVPRRDEAAHADGLAGNGGGAAPRQERKGRHCSTASTAS
jgi:aldehyde dehydrogenase (NAD+)